MKFRVVMTSGMDVWKNFAIEEFMVRNVKEDEIVFYLWQTDKNVMLGKNQNPWRECNVKLLISEGGVLSRRITGGGSIYCNHGNMLFSYITPKRLYDLDKQLSVILEACKKYGIHAEKSGRNDLTIKGKKFSGNAFFSNSEANLHHGSLLIKEDVDDLVRYLTPSLDKVTSKGIQSVRSRVTNISEHNKDVTVEGLKSVLTECFQAIYVDANQEITIEKDPKWFDNEEIQQIYERNKSWDWCFGKSAQADVILENRFEWGEVQLHIKLEHSLVDSVVIFSDALDQGYIESLDDVFTGLQFDAEVISNALYGYGSDDTTRGFSKDISEWLKRENF